MKATLYLPQQAPQIVSNDGLILPDANTGFARVTEEISIILGCAPNLVDVLACGPSYAAYSVFDCEGDTNHSAMAAVAELSGVSFELDDADARLCGPVLVVCAY